MPTKPDKTLFNLPVSKQWIEQYAIVQHQDGVSLRGILDGLKALLDVKRSIGWAQYVVNNAAHTAKKLNENEDLSGIKVSANDELFQGSKPILSAICTNSLYCPLLKKTDNRTAITWERELNTIIPKGYNPHSVILDGLSSLHAGHKLALGDIHIIYDTFHVLQDMHDLKRFARYRQQSTTTNLNTINTRLDKTKQPDKIKNLKKQHKVALAANQSAKYVYETIATLASWLNHDILVVAGDDYKTRKMLLKFISDSLLDIEEYMPHRIKPVRTTLENKADKILGFVKTLEDELELYANELNCDVYWLWQICYAQRFNKDKSNYYNHIAKAKSRLKHNFYHIEQSVIAIMNEIEKASSVVENLNGRVRKFLRSHIHVSQEMLDLFRFIINSSVFNRSRCEHRHGKSPSEVLNDKPHQHWLELLGYKLFKQAA